MGTHLNCIDLSMQFKCVPTTYTMRVIDLRVILIIMSISGIAGSINGEGLDTVGRFAFIFLK